jgi:phage-related holin
MLETTTITTLKIIWNFLIASLGILLTYLGLDAEAIAVLTVLLVVDYATGLAKAKRIHEAITSNKMKYGIASKLMLLVIPLSIALGAKGVDVEMSMLVIVCVNILIFSEMYSIVGNVACITSGKNLPEIDAASMIAKQIRNFLIKQAGEDK